VKQKHFPNQLREIHWKREGKRYGERSGKCLGKCFKRNKEKKAGSTMRHRTGKGRAIFGRYHATPATDGWSSTDAFSAAANPGAPARERYTLTMVSACSVWPRTRLSRARVSSSSVPNSS